MALRTELGQVFGLKKRIKDFLKPASPTEPSRGINQTSNAGKPEALATGTSIFLFGEKTLSPPEHRRLKERQKRERKNCRPHLSGRNRSMPLLHDDQQVTTSPPGPVKEQGDVTLNDADIPDSIARALFDALQENRTGNQLPAVRISGGSRRRLLTTAVNWRRGGNHQV